MTAIDRTLARQSDPQRHRKYDPIYEFDQSTGEMVFYANCIFDGMKDAGWHWWKSRPGQVPTWPLIGPFQSAYRAYCDALARFK